MKVLDRRVPFTRQTSGELRLPFDVRQKSRVRAATTGGVDVGIQLERGSTLADGDHLATAEGEVFVVRAEAEPVSMAVSRDPRLLLRAAYHLGNRHIRLEIGEGYVAYQPDHVLDEMVAGLGLYVVRASRPFEPEPGAYHTHRSDTAGSIGSQHSHHHHESHGHGHEPS